MTITGYFNLKTQGEKCLNGKGNLWKKVAPTTVSGRADHRTSFRGS